ncbi:MAG: hypothetical protein IJY62_01975 [Clostridia bacterium]|nr:hypothetical protein [Clostridia bacterium]
MKLAPIFTDHAVFPANKPVRIYGEGVGTVTVSLGNTCVSTEANGRWLVTFPPLPHGGPFALVVTCGNETVVLKDIYLGEVYLLSGQSNMEFKLHESTRPQAEYKSDEKIRLFTSDRAWRNKEHFRSRDGWLLCDKETAGHWTAIGYELAHCIREKRDVAIGLIACYQEASVIEAWLPEAIANSPEFFLNPEAKHWDHHAPAFEDWNSAGKLYNSLFLQIAPFAVTRVIWYQGESDSTVAEAEIYDRELIALMGVWRQELFDETLPVTVIQLADAKACYYPDGWKAIQEAQLRAVKQDPLATLIVSRDVCESDIGLHPPTKKLLARRIADSL